MIALNASTLGSYWSENCAPTIWELAGPILTCTVTFSFTSKHVSTGNPLGSTSKVRSGIVLTTVIVWTSVVSLSESSVAFHVRLMIVGHFPTDTSSSYVTIGS